MSHIHKKEQSISTLELEVQVSYLFPAACVSFICKYLKFQKFYTYLDITINSCDMSENITFIEKLLKLAVKI